MTENVKQSKNLKTEFKSIRLTPKELENWDPHKIHEMLNNGFSNVKQSDGNVKQLSQFKTAFKEIYKFFKGVMNNINIIVSTSQGEDLWNEKLQECNMELISEMGRLI